MQIGILTAVVFLFGWPMTGLAVWISWRFYRKSVIYDRILTYINDDLIANLRHFEKMSKSSILGNDVTIQEAHRLMMHMATRFNEISMQMEDATGLQLRPKPIGPRPVLR
jgi:hypothetical protein